MTQQEITSCHEKLMILDNNLSGKGVYGSRLKLYRAKALQNKQQSDNLSRFLEKINLEIEDIINETIRSLSQVNLHLHRHINPNEQSSILHGDITNWAVIQKVLKEKKYDMVDVHEKINAFFTMLEYSGFQIDVF
jgi:hypothetical protein